MAPLGGTVTAPLASVARGPSQSQRPDRAHRICRVCPGDDCPGDRGPGDRSPLDPTLSTLSGRNLIKTADLFSKQAEDVDLHIVETFNEIMHLPLYRHSDAVNAFQQLENPTQGR